MATIRPRRLSPASLDKVLSLGCTGDPTLAEPLKTTASDSCIDRSAGLISSNGNTKTTSPHYDLFIRATYNATNFAIVLHAARFVKRIDAYLRKFLFL